MPFPYFVAERIWTIGGLLTKKLDGSWGERENRSRRRVIRTLGDADSIKLIYISASDNVNKDRGETLAGDVQ